MTPRPKPAAPGLTPSPCVNLCKLDAERRWCTGCWRSLDEIVTWSRLSEQDKQNVWQALPVRRATHGAEADKA